MKRILLGSILLSSSALTFAVAPGGPNCGWGNMLFEGQAGLPSHVVASITNGTSGNGTFGMTSGTNGCSADGTLTYGGKSMLNVGIMMDEFTEDVAQGDGEVLSALAVSLGIVPEDRAIFKDAMHSNFDQLFPSDSVVTEQVVATMFDIMKNNERLAKYAS